MKLLLDTHVLIWWLQDSDRIRARARAAIEDGANEVYVSAASAWEIAIKAGRGKLHVPPTVGRWLPRELERNGFLALPIALLHALTVADLPPHHSDPFDRILLAQAKVEGMHLVSADEQMAAYDIAIVAP